MANNSYQRIAELLDYLGLNALALSKELGLKNPQIFYDIKAGKCGVSKSLARKIQERYLNIDPGWLMTGEGDMLRPGANNIQTARVGNVTATATSSGPDSSELAALRAENESLRAQVDRLTKIIENLTSK